MQENSVPVTSVATPQVVAQLSKSNSFLIILLSSLLFISVIIAGFFAYQTQRLVKELKTLKTEPESVFPIYTEQMEREDNPTVDPTADWKTYINTSYGYEIKYPERFDATNIADGAAGPALPNSIMVALIDKNSPPTGSVTIQSFQSKPSYPTTLIKSSGSVNNQTYEKYSRTNSDTYLFTSTNSRYVEILVDRNPEIDNQSVFDQILSTFKSTN